MSTFLCPLDLRHPGSPAGEGPDRLAIFDEMRDALAADQVVPSTNLESAAFGRVVGFEGLRVGVAPMVSCPPVAT